MGEPPLFGDVGGEKPGMGGHGKPVGTLQASQARPAPLKGEPRLSKNSCRGEHCSPVPVCLARNCPGKCVSAVSWRATNGRPYIRNKAGMQFFDSLSSPKRGAFLRGRSPRGKPPHQGRWPRSRPEGFGKLAGGCPLMRGRGQLRAAYMPPLQSSDLKQRPSREQQSLKTAGVRGNTRLKSGGRLGGVKNGQ